MTLKELYALIDGDYEQATRVLRMEKLMDKHIRKLPQSGTVENLLEAGESLEPTRMFEAAHAMKGVCANLGLVKLAQAASDIAEEYRSGNSRRMTDEEVKALLARIAALYKKTAEGIARYAAE